jgi:nitric oxide reductase NorD protein
MTRSDREPHDDTPFAAVDREMKAFIAALWRHVPPIHVLTARGIDAPRRTSFSQGSVRVPQSFRGFGGQGGKALFRAALAHVMAHFVFTPGRFPVGSLKPVQIALVSLIEDARVEQLVIREFPGLRRLWLPFHVAEPSDAPTAPALMARLSRALLDPDYTDRHGWVTKGHDLFFGDPARWEDPALSRTIGGLLGNDLGQMRAGFNAKTYVVEPPYRDDSQGIWDYPTASEETGETFYQTARLEAEERGSGERQRASADAGGANVARPAAEEAEFGVPVARYPEWDFLIGRERSDWTTVVEYVAGEGRAESIDRLSERYPDISYRIAALIRSAKVSRPVRYRRQREGDRLDLEAAITAAIDRRTGLTPSPNVYARLGRRWRDLSVLVLIDASQSTNDMVTAAGRSVLELERDATALLAEAMDGLGDPFAVHAFCSDTRNDVRYFRFKDFDMPWGPLAKRRLANVSGRFSTRMGAALRHAGREMTARPSYLKLLLLVSDGEPSDVDVADRRYLVEDARRAVLALRHGGIDVFCVGLDAGGDSSLPRIFGRRNLVEISRIEQLPARLPLLYFRLVR